MAGSEVDVSALYGLPLNEFTKARNELAKQARAQGDSEEAERIRALQKPSLPAWVLNMLARLHEVEMADLLAAGERAESAQSAALAGGEAGELREATEQLRRASRDLAGEAGEILVKGGHAAREQTQMRVGRALEAAAATAEGRRQLRAGAFEEAPEPSGFDVFTGLSAPSAPRRARAPAPKTDRAEARRAAQQAVDDARSELQARRNDRAEAQAAFRDAERAARARQREAERALELVERNRRRAQDAEAAEAEAKQRLDDAKERLRSPKRRSV